MKTYVVVLFRSNLENIYCDTHKKHLGEVLLMNITTYVFVEKHKKYQQFSVEKSALSGAMKTFPIFEQVLLTYRKCYS